MKIIIDHKIPFINGVFEPHAAVSYYPGHEITPEVVKDADALIVRTRTRCDADLLAGSKVKFVGTATIGKDHLDTAWLEQAGIKWANAPGCNADSVNQYFLASMLLWFNQHRFVPEEVVVGVVGVGNVGSRVAESCQKLGMKVLLNDPPRQRAEGGNQFISFEDLVQQADILTFHVPLIRSGADQTYHMVNNELISRLEDEKLLFNTCRGEVFKTRAIIDGIYKGVLMPPVIDCWEREPQINMRLLDQVYLATPHIAGYSQEGKANGTTQVVNALAKEFDLPLKDWKVTDLPAPDNPELSIDGTNKSPWEVLTEAILKTYPVFEDDELFREQPLSFEEMRGDYRIRREPQAFRVFGEQLTKEQKTLLKEFKFTIAE